MPPSEPSSNAAPVVIGLLGGIASGKSTVGRLLAGERGVVIDADRIARAVLETEEGASFLEEHFGPEVLDEGRRPRRAALADRVFGDAEALAALEAWTHPRVRERISSELEAARGSGSNPIVLDVPLLVENDAQHGLARLCDHLVFVDADEGEREKRARETRDWAPGERERREAAQWSMEQKRQAASHVITNHEGPAELEEEVQDLRLELVL